MAKAYIGPIYIALLCHNMVQGRVGYGGKIETAKWEITKERERKHTHRKRFRSSIINGLFE